MSSTSSCLPAPLELTRPPLARRHPRPSPPPPAVPRRRGRRCVPALLARSKAPELTPRPSAAVLPSQAHPSYPYGNPYKPHLSSTLRRGPSSSSSSRRSAADPSTHAASLATALPALELRELYERTTFGDAPDRQWGELHLGGLFGRRTRPEREEDEDERDTHGDAGPPAGQNAGDAPEDDSEGEMDDGSQDGVVVQ